MALLAASLPCLANDSGAQPKGSVKIFCFSALILAGVRPVKEGGRIVGGGSTAEVDATGCLVRGAISSFESGSNPSRR